MKINKMLIAVPAMLAVVLSSCKDDDPTVGIDSSMPAPAEVSYDEMNSSSSSIGVYWDANAALKSGATSFTVQILKKKDVAEMLTTIRSPIHFNPQTLRMMHLNSQD